MKYTIKLITGTLATFLVYLFGGWDVALQSLVVAIVLDYLSGLAKGYVTSTLNSSTGLKGIVKKVGILGVVALAVTIDNIAGSTGLIRTMVIYYLVANEGLSIVENLSAMDILIPDVLQNKLEQIRHTKQPKGGEENA